MIAFISAVAFFGAYYSFYQMIYVPVVFFAMSQFPAFYVYIDTLTSENGWRTKSLCHFLIPAVATIVAAVVHYILLSQEDGYRFISEILTGTPANHPGLKLAYFVDRLAKNSFILFGLFYYWLTNRKIRRHRERMNDIFSHTEDVNIPWIRIYNLTFFMTLAAGVFFHSMERSVFLENDHLLALTFVPLTVFFWIVGYYGNKQKEIYTPDVVALAAPLGNMTDLDGLRFRLQEAVQTQKIYLDPDINLPALARDLGTNRTYLSQLINQEFGMNFNQYINKHRTEEAQKLMKSDSGKSMTIREIGETCGFSTHQSFVRWFREYFDVTPGEYRKSQVC